MGAIQRVRRWSRHDYVKRASLSVVLALITGVLINDSAITLRLLERVDSPAPEVPVTASEARSAPHALYQDLAAALPTSIAPGSLHAISTSPMSILVLVPPTGGATLVACFYVNVYWEKQPPPGATMTWIAPTTATALSHREIEHTCYPTGHSYAVPATVIRDRVTGLSQVMQPIEPLQPPDPAVQEVSAVRWHAELLEPEGYGLRRVLISYDSDIPQTFGRLKLRSLESYKLNFSGTESAGYPTVRQSGVDVIVALQATNSERIISASPSANFDSGIRSSWRTSKTQPRWDLVLIVENNPLRRALDARVQRSSLALGILVPLIAVVSADQMRRAYRLRRSRRGKINIIILSVLTIFVVVLLVRLRVVPDVSDRLLSLLIQ